MPDDKPAHSQPTIHREDIEDLRNRFRILGDHYPIVGTAVNHDDVSRAYARGYSAAYREAAAYLADALIAQDDPETTD